ncbi:hypothetical protein [Shouchella lonarensis]|uniref:DUF4944 domain-containing protein n=1 Tax=Shouchella lonarensis TaxID=1464122 RepID=A0A1G6GII0_9BACI|nr:hypothetical protein [Shouchella lonarensis]SDB81818.1 hypothetical protein SAMN05421737_101113 [Shouchella lonarensis]
MTRNKGIVYFLGVVVAFVVIWMVYSINQSPKWVGFSDDDMWKVDYNRDMGSPKGEWAGTLYWMKKEEVRLLGIELIEDGEITHEIDYLEEGRSPEESRMKESNNKLTYLTSAGLIFKNEMSVKLKVRWDNGQGEHEDTIELFPKKRFFVVPVLDNLEDS